MPPAIFDVAAEIRAVLDRADPDTGELPVEFDELISGLGLSLDAEIDSLLNAAKAFELHAAVPGAQAEQHEAEAKRLRALERTRRNKAERCRQRVFDALALAEIKKHETPHHLVWLQDNPPALEFTAGDPELLAEHLQRWKCEPDKKLALDEYKATGTVPEGFELKHGRHLRVR